VQSVLYKPIKNESFFFQQLKDRYGELQKSQQLTVKEQNDLARQLEDVKARKVKYNLILIYR